MKASIEQLNHMRRLIKQHQDGNLSTTKFCRRHRVKTWVFRYWRRKLSIELAVKSYPISTQGAGQPGFLPVTIDPAPSSPTNQQQSIEIHYPSGMVIKFPPSLEINQLRHFIENREV